VYLYANNIRRKIMSIGISTIGTNVNRVGFCKKFGPDYPNKDVPRKVTTRELDEREERAFIKGAQVGAIVSDYRTREALVGTLQEIDSNTSAQKALTLFNGRLANLDKRELESYNIKERAKDLNS
jgi:hypothetical protein